MMQFLLASFFIIFFFTTSSVYGEESIFITKSSGLENIEFDGKWSNNLEWKQTSYDLIQYRDNTKIVLRTAHQNNFLYIQINAISDNSLEKGSDNATVCFDTNNDKSKISEKDDFCFFTSLHGKNSFTYQGGSIISLSGHFKKILNHDDFIAIGNTSGKYDRYSPIPHPTYEFKIPLELLGRSNDYGFYFSIFDANQYRTYSWPTNIETKNLMTIPNTDQWGVIVSPDKSIN